MKISKINMLGLCVGVALLFSGCMKQVKCQAEDNSAIQVGALKSNFAEDRGIIKNPGNPFSETVYNKNLKMDSNVITAEKSTLSVLSTLSGLVAPWELRLDANNDTVQIGNTLYECDKGLFELIQILEKDKNK